MQRSSACGLVVLLAACSSGFPDEQLNLDASVKKTDAAMKFDLASDDDFATGPKGCPSHAWHAGTYTVPSGTRPLLNAVSVAEGSGAPVYLGGMLVKTSDSSFYSGLVLRAESTSPTVYYVDTATDVGMPGYIDQQAWALAANGAAYLAGTGGRLMQRSGSTAYATVDTGVTSTLWTAWAPTSPVGVFIGGSGGILRNVNGTTITPFDRGASESVYGLWGTSASSFQYWAVGKGGKIWRGDGMATPVSESSPVTTDILAVWGKSASELYAVGRGGVILVSTGNGTWTSAMNKTMVDFYGVAGADNEIYAVGAMGKVVCSPDSGTTWGEIDVGASPTQDLIAIGARNGRVVIVGRGSQIIVR